MVSVGADGSTTVTQVQHLPAEISPHLLLRLSAGAEFWAQQVQGDGGGDRAAEDSASVQAQTAAAA